MLLSVQHNYGHDGYGVSNELLLENSQLQLSSSRRTALEIADSIMKRSALPTTTTSQTSSQLYTTQDFWASNSPAESMRYASQSTYVPLTQSAGAYDSTGNYNTINFAIPMSGPPTTSSIADYRRHSDFAATSLSVAATHGHATDLGNSTVAYPMPNRESRLQTTPPLQGLSRRHSNTYPPPPTVHQQRQNQQQHQQQTQHQQQQQHHHDQMPFEIQTSSPSISQAYTQATHPAMVQPFYNDNTNYFPSTLGSTSVSMDMPSMARASPIMENTNAHWGNSQAITSPILFSEAGLPETTLVYNYPSENVDLELNTYGSQGMVVTTYQRLPPVSAPAPFPEWTSKPMRLPTGNDIDTNHYEVDRTITELDNSLIRQYQPRPQQARRMSSNSQHQHQQHHQHHSQQRYPTASPRMIQHNDPMLAPTQERQTLKRKYSAVHGSPIIGLDMGAQSRRESTELAVEEDNSLNSILGRKTGSHGGAFHVLRIPDPQQGAGELGGDGREVVQSKKKTKRPAADHERAETKLKREEGVCFRCKIYKEKCRGGLKLGPCERCSKISGPWREICCSVFLVHSAVLGKKLYRERVMVLLENVESWGTGATRKIQVSNGYSDLYLDLDIRDFKPKNRKLLDHVFWRETKEASFDAVESSAFGLSKHDEEAFSKEALDNYLDGHVGFLLDEMRERQNKSYMLTLTMAYELMQKNGLGRSGTLIRKVFRIWAAINLFFHKPWRITGEDKFSMGQINNSDSKCHGLFPLPRLLNQQLDSIIEHRIEELEKEALKDLQEMALKHQDGSESYVLYLAIFVYLCGLERDTWCLEAWKTELARQTRIRDADGTGVGSSNQIYLLKWPLQDDPSICIERNKVSAKYISHYTQSIFRGGLPFGPPTSKPAATLNKSGTEAKEYREKVAKMIQTDVIRQEEKEDLRQRREANYEKSSEDCLDSQFAAKLIIDDSQLFSSTRGGAGGSSAPRKTSPSKSRTTSTAPSIGGNPPTLGGEGRGSFGGVGGGAVYNHHQQQQYPQQHLYQNHNNIQHHSQPQLRRPPPSMSAPHSGNTNHAFGSDRR